MIKDFNAATSALKFWICSILKLLWLLENAQDLFGTGESRVEGFSRGFHVVAICSVAIPGFTL